MKKLVSSRVVSPKLNKNLLIRQELLKKIQSGFQTPVLILEAGAGHGKTTTLRQALEKQAIKQFAWVNLAEDTNNLTLFWSYMIESMSPYVEKEQLTTYFQQSVREGTLDKFGFILLEYLPTEPFYLILDDFHFIFEEKLVASIDQWIEYLPEAFHLILITRYKPSIYLGKLFLDGKLTYIKETDFLLSEHESLALINRSTTHFSKDTRNELIQHSKGWLAGLQLLILSSKLEESKYMNAPERTVLFDYLTKEIINHLTKSEKNFLIQTAYYPFVFKELSEELFPAISYVEMISQLQEQNIMMTELDDESERYVYHPLIKEALIQEFFKIVPKEIKNQKEIAANLFIMYGYFDEGIALLFELNEYPQIMTLLIDEQQNLRSSVYIQRVPDERAIKNIDFTFLKLFYYYTVLNYDGLERLIVAMETNYPSMQAIQVLGGIRLLFGLEVAQINTELMTREAVYELSLNDVSKAFVFLKNAMICYYNNEFRQAIELVKESMYLNSEKRNPTIFYFNQTFLAQIYEEIGEFDRSLTLLNSIYHKIDGLTINDKMNKNYYLNFDLTIAGIYLKKMALEEAERVLNNVSEQAHPHMRASYLYNHAELCYLQNKPEQALISVRELEKTDYYQNLLLRSGLLRLLRYMLKSNHIEERKKEEYRYFYENETTLSLSNQLFYGMLLVEKKEDIQALAIADQALEISRKEQIYFRIISADLLKIDVLLHSEKNEERQIIDLYQEALYYGSEYTILCEFILYKEVLSQLFDRAESVILNHLESRQRKFHETIKQRIQYNSTKSLSKREKEVLIEISKGFTNKEISNHLFISMATTKTHILNIYRKLEVKSRVAVIEEARKKGLL